MSGSVRSALLPVEIIFDEVGGGLPTLRFSPELLPNLTAIENSLDEAIKNLGLATNSPHDELAQFIVEGSERIFRFRAKENQDWLKILENIVQEAVEIFNKELKETAPPSPSTSAPFHAGAGATVTPGADTKTTGTEPA